MSAGKTVWSPSHQKAFAEPKISYHLTASIELTLESGQVIELRTAEPIKLWTTAAVLPPPVSVPDFNTEYRTLTRHHCSAKSASLELEISAREPAALAFTCGKSSRTVTVELTINLVTSEVGTGSGLIKLLAKANLNATVELRSK
jgi:hypothetical protein